MDFDKLYKLGKFENVSHCAECFGCGKAEPPHWLYLYPGEFEYRIRRHLFPDFEMSRTLLVAEDTLFECLLAVSGTQEACKDAPLTCRMSPIQVWKRPGKKALVEFVGVCDIQNFERQWVIDLAEMIVEVYVNQGVKE